MIISNQIFEAVAAKSLRLDIGFEKRFKTKHIFFFKQQVLVLFY